MREPEPTPADQWSGWETEPKPPAYWPGLGNEQRQGGLEIDRKVTKAVAGKLVGLATDADMDGTFERHGSLEAIPNLHWRLPGDLGRLLQSAGALTRLVWSDLHAEVGMAGLLIERASARYDLVESPRLGDIPLSELAARMPGEGPLGRAGQPSHLYPKGSDPLELAKGTDYGVGDMTAAKAVHDFSFSTFWLYGNVPAYFDAMAASLVELANTLPLRAQDLRDAPWHGEAADMAQGALRQIHGNVTSLAATAGTLNAAAERYKEIVYWCSANFEKAVDPHRGGWDEFWDLGGTADSRTRSFLGEANNAFTDIYQMMPKRISLDLPGLLVNDDMTAGLRSNIDRLVDFPELSAANREWLADNKPLLRTYEKAEQTYG
ncbi:hypothetical protein [Nonomuraea glycinis]|uniref:hypothetical protein n=1 Tax=Nonomuraea glycinis TaxID=2047744 RepID=UPI002E123DA4|nr:hypothetical protein OHA68_16485 [Nonomuraea glycinis]